MRITLYALFLMLGIVTGTPQAMAQCSVGAGPDQVLNCATPSVTLVTAFNAFTPAFQWAGPGGFVSTVQSPLVDMVGTYTVTMTDTQNGCTATDEVLVTQLALTPTVNPIPCPGGANGSISIAASGGNGPYNYQWSTGATGIAANSLAVGTYTVTVTDADGCTTTSSATMTEPPALVINTTITNVSCFGNNDGAVMVTVSGGTPVYTFNWSNGTVSCDVTGVLAGTYTLTVTDANNCTATTSATVTQPPALVLSTVVGNVLCNGGASGSIDLTVTGGTPGYTYIWSNNAITQDMNNLAAGTYTVTVTDQKGCTKTSSATITQPPVIALSAVANPVTCNGTSNGSINLTVTGGVPAYTYLWSNGSTTEDQVNMIAGTYTVTVTDTYGCVKTTSSTITQPQQLVLTITPVSIACNGDNNGALNLTVTGGVPPYIYTWSNGANTEDMNNLPAGIYTVTVTDLNACTKTASAAVTQPPPIVLNYTTNDTPCGANLDLTVSGGVPAYTYDWSNDGPESPDNDSQDLTSLATGMYTVTVTDALGCTGTTAIPVGSAVNPLVIGLPVVTSVLCFGGATGAINITVSGGLAPYSYDWSNDGPEVPDNDTQDLSSLIAGLYTVTVTDVNGCTTFQSTTINQPGAIVVTALITPVSCFGGADGGITITVNGGPLPYFYLWSNGTSAQNPNNLTAGNYTVTVTDGGGCTTTTLVTIPQPPAISLLPASFCDGVLTVQAAGGISPYLYQWNTGEDTSAIAVLPGTYTVTVTDTNSCTFQTEVYAAPNPLPCTKITGNLKYDANGNCLPDSAESGIGNWIVKAVGTDTYYGICDAGGHYEMPVAPGNYEVLVVPPANTPLILCQTSLDVSLPAAGSTAVADFAVQDIPECPAMTVDLSTPMLRRCFSSNYFVHYCNVGPVEATDAYLTIQFDQYLNILAADLPYTFIGNHTYQFNLGTVAPYACGDFKVKVNVSCGSIPGQTHCSEAHIYPDTLCVPPNVQWSGAEVALESRCNNDSLHFVLRNIGTDDMLDNLKYIVIEDGVMGLQSMSPPLASGDSMVVSVLANGSTWRLEASQESFFPGQSVPVLSVEGCPAASSFSTGYLSQFPVNDADPWLDVDCTVNTGSYDPNDKQGFPTGYGDAHYIKPGTEIEYMIRFQNTGTDTAFHVVVLDTLSGWLDPASLQLGAASHPYQFSFQGPGGVLVFDFQDIMLPDSNVNEPESHGFIKFRIAPRAGVTNETDIHNNAAIYFDFNDPVFTNTTTHRIGTNFVLVSEWHPQVPDYQILIQPNPVQTEAIVLIKAAPPNGEYTLHLYNLTGSLIKTLQSDTPEFRLQRDGIAAGAYLFRIERNGAPAGWGKIIVKGP